MGRPKRTCASLELETLCEACANPKLKQKCLMSSAAQRPRTEESGEQNSIDDEGGKGGMALKPAKTGRPASTCARLGFAMKCRACSYPQHKQRCLVAAELLLDDDEGLDARESHCTTALKSGSYLPEDWRTDKHTLPLLAQRKGTQNARTAELNAVREARDAEIRKQGFLEGIEMSQHENEELETMVDTLKQQLDSQSAELFKIKRERNAMMAAKRQRALETWLTRHPTGDRAELQLPTRTSHFDAQADAAKGYSKSELRRTFRSHVERIEHFIESMVDDPLKQLQLADAVSRRFGGVKSSMPHDDEAASYVLESLKNFEATLRERFSGRYPNVIRAAHQAVSAAITSKVPRNKLSVVANATGFSLEALADGRRRWVLWFDGTQEQLVELRGQTRSDKMDEAWLEFAAHVWETETRPDPSTKCSIRNPHSRADKKLYRIHYLDMRIGDMHQLILERGREKFADADPPFHFSWWYCIKVSSSQVTSCSFSCLSCRSHCTHRFDHSL